MRFSEVNSKGNARLFEELRPELRQRFRGQGKLRAPCGAISAVQGLFFYSLRRLGEPGQRRSCATGHRACRRSSLGPRLQRLTEPLRQLRERDEVVEPAEPH